MNHAIVGCGRVAENHIKGIINNKSLQISHLIDVDLTKAQYLKKKFNLSANTWLYDRNVFETSEFESVSICTSHNSHLQIAEDAIRCSKNVLLEKPPTVTFEEFEKLKSIAAKSSVVIAPVFQHRFDPNIVRLLDLINKNRLGRITSLKGYVFCGKSEDYYETWRGKIITEGGSALINQGIHTLDLMSLIGGKIVDCTAYKTNRKFYKNDTEDSLVAILNMENGCFGSILCENTKSFEWKSGLIISGEKGVVNISTGFPDNIIDSVNFDDFEHGDCPVQSNIEGNKNYYGVSHYSIIENYSDACTGAAKLIWNLESCTNTMFNLDAIYKNAVSL